MKSYFQRKYRESRENVFATFKEKVTGIKFHENLRIKMSREFKVANCWKNKCGRWKVQNKGVATLYMKKLEKKMFFKKVESYRIKCRDK